LTCVVALVSERTLGARDSIGIGGGCRDTFCQLIVPDIGIFTDASTGFVIIHRFERTLSFLIGKTSSSDGVMVITLTALDTGSLILAYHAIFNTSHATVLY